MNESFLDMKALLVCSCCLLGFVCLFILVLVLGWWGFFSNNDCGETNCLGFDDNFERS